MLKSPKIILRIEKVPVVLEFQERPFHHFDDHVNKDLCIEIPVVWMITLLLFDNAP